MNLYNKELPNLKADMTGEFECYKAIVEIKAILENDSLEDVECFMKIEEIVKTIEKLGWNVDNRHDFG